MPTNSSFSRNWATTWAMNTPAAGDTLAAATMTSFATAPTIKANSLQPNQVFVGTAYGVYGAALSLAGTIAMAVKLGSVTLGSTNTSLTLPLGAANRGFKAEWQMTVVSIGTVGKVEFQSVIGFEQLTGQYNFIAVTNTAPVTVNTTIDNVMALAAQFSSVLPSNVCTLRSYRVSVLLPIADSSLYGVIP